MKINPIMKNRYDILFLLYSKEFFSNSNIDIYIIIPVVNERIIPIK